VRESRCLLTVTPDQLTRYANDVAVLWDEAQDNPALLRFLSPFGRPDLGRLVRRFRSTPKLHELIGEGYPMFATWLATMVLRDGLHAAAKSEMLTTPQWDTSMLTPTLELAQPLELPKSRFHTLVIAGSLKAPSIVVRDARLVVAGDLETQLLVADGCVLVGGSVKADIVALPATSLAQKEKDPYDPARPLGCQVSREVSCRVFDSPRFGIGCPVKADVVVRGVGVTPTPQADERLRETLVPLALKEGRLELGAIASLIARGLRVFN
jgi:hypothetical protein